MWQEQQQRQGQSDIGSSAHDHLRLVFDHACALVHHLFEATRVAVLSTQCCNRSTSKNSFCLIYPTDPWKQRWDMVVAVLIMYSAVSVPIRLGFDADAEGAIWLFEVMVSLTFILDMLFSFRTTHVVDGVWETDGWKVAFAYSRSWLWVDGPSSIPFELIELYLDSSTANQYGEISAMRMLRLFRLVRLLRVFKVDEYLTRLEEHHNISINIRALRLITLLVKLLFCVHMLACGWYYLALLSEDESNSWVANKDITLYDQDLLTKYLYCSYWVGALQQKQLACAIAHSPLLFCALIAA
jgi:hypothetical protein